MGVAIYGKIKWKGDSFSCELQNIGEKLTRRLKTTGVLRCWHMFVIYYSKIRRNFQKDNLELSTI